MLELDGLSVGYEGPPVVRDLTLSVGEGEVVALVGANGAGKTTTLRAISGLLKPVAGAVRLLLIGLLTLFWPRLVDLVAHIRNANDRTRTYWLALRWRVTGWLLIIELVLGRDLLGRFLNAVSGVAV